MIGLSIITMVLSGILGLGQSENNSAQNNHIQSVTSFCKVAACKKAKLRELGETIRCASDPSGCNPEKP